MNKRVAIAFMLLTSLVSLKAWAADINEVTFLNKVQTYEAVVDTSLVTPEGKRILITRGTKLNVAGFTASEAFVISRKDKPNAFVKRADIAPVGKQAPLKY